MCNKSILLIVHLASGDRLGVRYKYKKEHQFDALFCDSDRIQTCNLLIRSQMLYSVELRSRYAAKLLYC